MTNPELGSYLARKLLECGDSPPKLCTRIEFKCGDWPIEVAAGGLAEEPLSRFFTQVLDNLPT